MMKNIIGTGVIHFVVESITAGEGGEGSGQGSKGVRGSGAAAVTVTKAPIVQFLVRGEIFLPRLPKLYLIKG
jgi:hypothetical protein